MEFELKNTMPFILAFKKSKYLDINLTNMYKIYIRKTTTLMNEIIEELNNWKGSPCSWVERLNIVKMSGLSNLIYRFMQSQPISQEVIFVDIKKLVLKVYMKRQKT